MMYRALLMIAVGLWPFMLLRAQENTAEQPASQLDLSRTNPVHNTPSRIPLQESPSSKISAPGPDAVSTAGMIWIPGGQFDMGAQNGLPREQPVHAEEIKGFYMDAHPVTVAQYRTFVEATGYKTDAEKFGDAAVFDLRKRRWKLLKGAYWAYPHGPQKPAAPDDHPVTQVSWQDAQAYCTWMGRRLPTEAEWEHAARNGRNERTRYSWGQEILNNEGKYRANIWQGSFPAINTAADGYLYTSPVGEFGKTKLGLMDMSGNVWEWCEDTYASYDPNRLGRVKTEGVEKVLRGGSFMCDPGYCHGYRVSGRSGSSPESGLFHVGFRTVKSP